MDESMSQPGADAEGIEHQSAPPPPLRKLVITVRKLDRLETTTLPGRILGLGHGAGIAMFVS